MKNTSFDRKLVLMLSLLGVPVHSQAAVMERSRYDFSYQVNEVKKTNDFLLSYHLSSQATPSSLMSADNTYKGFARALGVADRSRDQVYGLLVRAVYILDKNIDTHVRHEVLNNTRYINHLMGSNVAQKVSSNTIVVDKVGTRPGYKAVRDLYESAQDLERDYGIKVSALPALSSAQGKPRVFLIQDLNNFSKIMNVNTSKNARNLIVYTEISSSKTLVEMYTLVHLYNIPPKVMGGASRLKKDYIQAVQETVARENSYRP